MSNPRAARVAERIQQIIARRLEKGLRDPRLGFVTITDVRVTGDLQHASVFYTVYGSEEELADTAAALKAATGMMRSEVGKQLGTRLTPTLEFIHDELPESAQHMNDLLAEARRRDEQAQQLASTATYAGDEDPYSKPRVEEPDSDDDDDEDLDEIEDGEFDDTDELEDFEDEDEDGLDEDELDDDENRD